MSQIIYPDDFKISHQSGFQSSTTEIKNQPCPTLARAEHAKEVKFQQR